MDLLPDGEKRNQVGMRQRPSPIPGGMLKMLRPMIALFLFLLLVGCSLSSGNEPSGNMTEEMQNVAVIWPGANEAVDAQPVLQWDAFPEAAQYQVTIINSDTNETVFTQKTTERVMPVTPPLPGGIRYTWTVQAQDANGQVIGEVHTFFRVKALLETVEPANLATTSATPTLIWKPCDNAVTYQVVLLDDDAYPPVVVSDEESKETSFAVATPLEPGSYSWTVWAKDANGAIIAEANNQFMVEQ